MNADVGMVEMREIRDRIDEIQKLLQGQVSAELARSAQRSSYTLLGVLLTGIVVAGLAVAAYPLGASIGIAFFPQDATDVQGLVAAADAAMYAAKRAGKNRIAFYATAVAAAV